MILFTGASADISGGLGIIFFSFRQTFSVILNNNAEMRVYMVIILYIVFVVRRRYKQRIKVDNLNA